MSDPPRTSEPLLPLRIKLAYGAPSFAGAGMAIPIVIHLTIFYSDEVLVPLGFIALVKAIARAFDALTDPVMGWVTDHTRSRWGRRRPWMMIGAPLAALSFIALFAPPEDLTPGSAAVWFALAYVSYYLFHTVYEIPHGGLGPEPVFSVCWLLLLRRQHFLELAGGRSRLRRVRLVGDDRVAALLEAAAVFDGLEHEGEGLDRHDDDRLAVLQRVRELLGLGALALVPVDAPDDAIRVLELVDGVLKLVI